MRRPCQYQQKTWKNRKDGESQNEVRKSKLNKHSLGYLPICFSKRKHGRGLMMDQLVLECRFTSFLKNVQEKTVKCLGLFAETRFVL